MKKMIEESDMNEFYKILCKNSINKDPKLAVLEWDYEYSYVENNYCICGNKIKENCIIKNRKNNNTLIVGNICVYKFITKDYDFVFKGIRAVNKHQMPNKSFINYCFDRGYIFENQRNFLLNIFRKRKLTEKQKEFKLNMMYKLKLRKRY